MLRTKAHQKGFTIVELLIVIAVIGILGLLVLNAVTGAQARARDVDRLNDINAIATHLEIYHGDEGEYPTLANMQDATPSSGWIATNLEGLDLQATVAPGDTPAANGNSIVNDTTPDTDAYGYVPAPADCDNVDTRCASYTLYYAKEEDGSVQSKASLNN